MIIRLVLSGTYLAIAAGWAYLYIYLRSQPLAQGVDLIGAVGIACGIVAAIGVVTAWVTKKNRWLWAGLPLIIVPAAWLWIALYVVIHR